MNVGQVLKEGTSLLRSCQIETPRLDAEVLLAFVLQKNRAEFLICPERELDAAELEKYRNLLEKRSRGVPVAYLLGSKEFMSLAFKVTPQVLIPRPETELLVERALRFLKALEGQEGQAPLVADVGTGSGAIAVSLAYYHSDVKVFATDISREALAVAAANARSYGLEKKICFYQGDLLEPLLAEKESGVLVAANLPYIPSISLAQLPLEVSCEPVTALDGGSDGLDLYRRLLPQAAKFLRPGGLLLCEVGPGQARSLAGLLPPELWRKTRIEKDCQGQERLLTTVRSGNINDMRLS
jgi:release factor glutamine methyltransferase